MNSRQFLKEYREKPKDKRRLCSRCLKPIEEGNNNGICGLCSYLQGALIHKRNKKRNINKEATAAGFTLRISSARTNAVYNRRHKNFVGVRLVNSRVISINTRRIKKISQKRNCDEAKVAAAAISHEYFHHMLSREQDELTSVLFDSPFMKKTITDYLGGTNCFRFYKNIKEELLEQAKYELIKEYPEKFGLVDNKQEEGATSEQRD